MADFEYVPCPKCEKKFMVGEEFFRLPEARIAPMSLKSASQPATSRPGGDKGSIILTKPRII